MANFDRKKLLQWIPLALAVVMILGACYVQGIYSERWGKFEVLARFSQQLKDVPMEFGNWVGVELPATEDALLKVAGAEGELVRLYRKKDNPNEQVQVSLICARMQDCFYHTPERCYPAAGFEMQGKETRAEIVIGDGEAEFKTAVFRNPSPTGSQTQRGYWSFNGDGPWVTPEYKKIRFLGQQQAIYKLYVFSNVSSTKKKDEADQNICEEFIKEFLPVLDAHLRPALVETGRIKESPSDAPRPAASTQASAK